MGDCNRGPEIDLPFTVGVTPGVSEDESDDEDVSGSEDELMELFTAPVDISFRAIALAPPDTGGCEELVDSMEGRDSSSSLNFDSCEDRRAPAFSAISNGLGDSVLRMLTEASLRGGTVDVAPDADLNALLSLLTRSDCELFREVPDLFPFGTSPNLNF